MKRLLLLSLLVPALAAAGVPDEDMILDRTMDAQSAFYYPALMMRYNAGDETLTDEDYHYLYYGYAYRDEYKPLAVNPDLDKMLMLASGIDPDKPDRVTLETMVSVGNDALKRDPIHYGLYRTFLHWMWKTMWKRWKTSLETALLFHKNGGKPGGKSEKFIPERIVHTIFGCRFGT